MCHYIRVREPAHEAFRRHGDINEMSTKTLLNGNSALASRGQQQGARAVGAPNLFSNLIRVLSMPRLDRSIAAIACIPSGLSGLLPLRALASWIPIDRMD